MGAKFLLTKGKITPGFILRGPEDIKNPELKEAGEIWDNAEKDHRKKWCEELTFWIELRNSPWVELNHCERKDLAKVILEWKGVSIDH